MIYTVYTLFPALVDAYRQEALLAKAEQQGHIEVRTRDLRRFAGNRTNRVDDAPYGGGAGMVIRVDVAAAALEEVSRDTPPPDETILLSPAGEPLTQRLVETLATKKHVMLLSGRYEGFDARVETRVDREISIGDFVLMGGELPALCVIEAVTRLLPGVLGAEESHQQDSFTTGLLDYPEYTRPPVFEGDAVPEILTSGHHERVARWRREAALKRTLERRPDLLHSVTLSEDERKLLATWETARAEARAATNVDDESGEDA